METTIPDRDEAQALVNEIKEAWDEEPMPAAGEVVISDVDSPPIQAYFGGRPVESVWLGDDAISNESSLIYMTPTGIKYYLQCFFYYCLDIEFHSQGPVPGCGDPPCIGLLSYLCGKRILKIAPDFNGRQVRCIVRFLEWVMRYEDFYYIDPDERPWLSKGVSKWRKLGESL